MGKGTPHQKMTGQVSGHGTSGTLHPAKLAAPTGPKSTPVKTPMPSGSRKA